MILYSFFEQNLTEKGLVGCTQASQAATKDGSRGPAGQLSNLRRHCFSTGAAHRPCTDACPWLVRCMLVQMKCSHAITYASRVEGSYNACSLEEEGGVAGSLSKSAR
jgi:hypothetical protein